MRSVLTIAAAIFAATFLSFLCLTVAPRSVVAQSTPNPYDLIAAVNALRTANGLPAYTINSILMQIAQDQANYQAAIGQVTHIGPGGTRPYQRALAAGYPLAGDLTRGGFIAENVFYGTSIQEAVNWWYNSPTHYNTMMSPNFREIGAGIASGTSGWYFTIVAASPTTGGTPQPYTPLPGGGWSLPTPTIATSTPNPDGAIIHVVQPGDTLGALSMAYDVPLRELLALNKLTMTSVIYPGQKIIIRPAYTITPTQPTSTPTRRPTSTPWPTSTRITLTVPPSPQAPPVPALQPSASAGGAVLAIVVVSLLAAGAITFWGARRS